MAAVAARQRETDFARSAQVTAALVEGAASLSHMQRASLPFLPSAEKAAYLADAPKSCCGVVLDRTAQLLLRSIAQVAEPCSLPNLPED